MPLCVGSAHRLERAARRDSLIEFMDLEEEDATGDSSGLAETAKALHTWRGFAAERAALMPSI